MIGDLMVINFVLNFVQTPMRNVVSPTSIYLLISIRRQGQVLLKLQTFYTATLKALR